MCVARGHQAVCANALIALAKSLCPPASISLCCLLCLLPYVFEVDWSFQDNIGLPLNIVSLRPIHATVGVFFVIYPHFHYPGLPPLAPVTPLCITDENGAGGSLAQRWCLTLGRPRYFPFSLGRPNHKSNFPINRFQLFLVLGPPGVWAILKCVQFSVWRDFDRCWDASQAEFGRILTFCCNVLLQVTTVEVGGSFTLIVYGDATQVFTNVRFGVTGGAHLFLTGVNTEMRMMRFTGTTNLVRSQSRWMLLWWSKWTTHRESFWKVLFLTARLKQPSS